MSKIKPFLDAARLAPIKTGPIPDDGTIYGAEPKAIFIIDAQGRLFEVISGRLSNGELRQITNPRAALGKLMDDCDMQDIDWDVSPKPPIL